MASTPASKGTRKTYSFEEREILVNLIYKYLVDGDEEKPLDISGSGSKKKSAWSQLTEEYNSLVGSDNSRTSIQLRRCWENMKANKKNRDDKRFIYDYLSTLAKFNHYLYPLSKRTTEKTASENLPPQLPPATVALPPNVVFRSSDSEPFTTTEKIATADPPLQLLPTSLRLPPNAVLQPNDSEPFAFEGLLPSTFQRLSNTGKLQNIDIDIELNGHAAGSEQVENRESVAMDKVFVDTEDPPSKKMKKKSPKNQIKPKLPKSNKMQKNELYEYTISEAQLKLDTAALLKEEAKLKLEEAEYRKEEARMRMICANYKLQRLREDCEAAIDDREEK
ncbi:hypothetical protein TSAR_004201 [Trichomalopsis sarcophagae]|uniref:Regulatory protein zeste n=1 Tax=Trichomalopsis sarcophagae TaxID=543379 RepID=A0A232FA83_9HYME|nr:hypothetical protein TSAR_004201 [Trichomalopsis sarcophagae]